ncbi:MAG: restriction endonuclease subunit R [Tildeniella nuda ZEHNDER 1965/U140]|jgi:hypothetical protein|nr:restriction endonuclease subunit R [Tildeniella nuda ZEHNDER 1965/U140]
MVQTLQARNVTLRHLIDNFGLQLIRDEQFFREWQDVLPDITDAEKQFLDKVQEGYFNLIDHPPLLEKAVQIAILGPVLFVANFFLPPFHIQAERSVEISAEDEGITIRGQADLILLKEQLWVMAIESKEASFSIEAGLAQLLAYMLANPHPSKPSFGLIVTGGSFMFVKLVQGNVSQYAISRIFEIRNPGNDLYSVVAILKHIGQL